MNRTRASLFILALVLVASGAEGCTHSQEQEKNQTNTEQSAPSETSPTPVKRPELPEPTQVISGRFADVDIVEISPGLWRMYYGVEPEVPGNQFEIYTATSTDGITWDQRSEPILKFATFPDIIKLPDGQLRLYFQDGQTRTIGSAISEDGVNFTREAGSRIAIDDVEGQDGVGSPTTIMLSDGTSLMIFRGSVEEPYSETSINQTTTAFFAATSSDGLNFTVGDRVLDGRTPTFDGYIDGNELFYTDDGDLHLRFWTSAGKENGTDAGQYNMVSSDDGKIWSEPIQFLSIQEAGFVGGDPIYTTINGEDRMYLTLYGKGIFFIPLE